MQIADESEKLAKFSVSLERTCRLFIKYPLKDKMVDIIDIDGSVMEGGGQILRLATSFSILLRKPIRVYNIRAGRKNPGLRPQHLAGLQLAAELCGGILHGGQLGSSEITFHPGELKCGRFSADPGTAGSIMLLFQVAFPCLLFAPGPSELHLKGGTNAEMAPQIDYTLMVFKPILELFGAKFECNLIKRGYYPKGGGEVIIKVIPVENSLCPIEILELGFVKNVTGLSFVAGVLPIKLAHDVADSAKVLMRKELLSIPLDIPRVKHPNNEAFGNGSGIVLVANSSSGCLLGSSALGKKDLQPKHVAYSATLPLLEDIISGACVDRFMQDQLIIFMALAKGKSSVGIGEVTTHTSTAILIAEMLSEAKFNVGKFEDEERKNLLECVGIGLEV